MPQRLSLDELWNTPSSNPQSFACGPISRCPEGVQKFLRHAIAPGTPLARAVRLRMHGEIKLKGWCPFTAEQVIHWDAGMIWRAEVRMCGLAIRGADSFLDGQGEMRWKLLGLFPVMQASGSDISRSAAGRVNIESVWLPSVLCGTDVIWTEPQPRLLHAHFTSHGETAEIDYQTGPDGALRSVRMPRWGNPEAAEFHYADFGGTVEGDRTFGGYTIPTSLRVGWADSEFFRVTIDDAIYR